MAAGSLAAMYCLMEGNQASTGPAIVNFGVADLDYMDFNENTLLCDDGHFRTLPQSDQGIADKVNCKVPLCLETSRTKGVHVTRWQATTP